MSRTVVSKGLANSVDPEQMPQNTTTWSSLSSDNTEIEAIKVNVIVTQIPDRNIRDTITSIYDNITKIVFVLCVKFLFNPLKTGDP